jgi:hypothetical protein
MKAQRNCKRTDPAHPRRTVSEDTGGGSYRGGSLSRLIGTASCPLQDQGIGLLRVKPRSKSMVGKITSVHGSIIFASISAMW